MHIPSGVVSLEVRLSKLAESIETAASLLKSEGNEVEALALFQLRRKIREGLSYEEAKVIFNNHTESLFSKKS